MDTKKNGWGGRRAGAGRPARGAKPRSRMLTFRVTEETARRINELRDATREDTEDFVDMLEAWVKDLAGDYGIE